MSEHFFSELADEASLIEARRRKAKEIVGLLRPYVQGRAIHRALSVGSSYCLIEEAIHAELVPDAEFICTDLDTAALYRFEQPGMIKRELSAMALDYPEASFDLIVAHQVLEHINGYAKILDDFRRLTRPGALIYINVPNPLSPMIGKLPNGRWPRPLLRHLWQHNWKKLKPDFATNTEAYHTGFTERILRRSMPGFSVHDLRKPRLKQVFTGTFALRLIDLFPRTLLFLPVETNLWCLVKDRSADAP